jgi:rhodanese-related sulfurtransferase
VAALVLSIDWSFALDQLDAHEVRLALCSGRETAFLDVREHGQYGEGHPLRAVNVPYSRLEFETPALLPCRSTSIILLDDDDGVAEKAAVRLDSLGYRNLAILEGGVAAWAAEGMTLFKGVNVPSKALGELVEQYRHTPALEPHELRAWRDRGKPFVLVDGRTAAEHAKMTIPGAVSCPNAELAHRLPVLVADGETPVVVHCAGRTRSIIGAESLRALGVRNPVYALRNGTQGWRLAGFELVSGASANCPAMDAQAREVARQRAREFRRRCAIQTITLDDLDHWRTEEGRTLYVFDVRTDVEYRAGHLAGARHAPGGQLVQATDHWIVVLGARIVLVDDTGLRAGLVAFWLRQMGHHVVVLEEDVTQLATSQDPPEPPGQLQLDLPEAHLADIPEVLRSGAVILDLNPSLTYRTGHVDGARWAIRPRLGTLVLKRSERILVMSRDPRIAQLAALDLREMGLIALTHAGGTVAEWRAVGLPVVATPDEPRDEDCIDYLFFVHDRHDGNLESARQYLEWETNLVHQMDAFDRAMFRLPVDWP